MPTIDRALYAFAATMILLAAVGHTVFLSPHGTKAQPAEPAGHPVPLTVPFEGSMIV